MDNRIESRVRELVADFKLEEALDLLIAQAQTQTLRKQNSLLVLKGKLALLEEQHLSGMLDPADVARQKAAIAHQLLDIADGSPLDHEPSPSRPEEAPVQQPVPASPPASTDAGRGRYLLFGGLLAAALVAGFLFAKSAGANSSGRASKEEQHEQAIPEKPTDGQEMERNPGGPLKVLNFPNLQQPFNFLDFGVEFRWADAEWVSDDEIRLKIRCYLTCKSNLGICYKAALRLYADGSPIAPAERSHTAAWVDHDATVTDDLSFVLPAAAQEFHVELSRDGSTWKRPFKILR